jgi:acyl carrier protein
MDMQQADIQATLRRLLEPKLKDLGLTNAEVPANESLLRSGILDSFAWMELLTQAESELGAELDLNELPVEELTSIQGLSAAFAKALSA